MCSDKKFLKLGISKAAQNNGLQGRLKNHSDCETCISRLLGLDIPVIYVTQLQFSIKTDQYPFNISEEYPNQ